MDHSDACRRERLLKRASWIAITGNGVLALLKVGVGHFGGSLAVLGDGIDSSADVAIAIMTLVIAGIVMRPGDREHPSGHGRAETVATTVLSFIVFFAGAQLLWGAVSSIIRDEVRELPSRLALVVTVVSIVGKLLLAWSQAHYGRLAESSMLAANARNMRMDVLTSVSVLVGLVFTFVLGMPLLDRIVAALVALWILKTALGIFREANAELMDGGAGHALYAMVFDAVATVPLAHNPHRTRIRRLGAQLVVDLDVEVDPAMSVADAHQVATAVEQAIKARLPEVYDVMVHLEPEGAGCHDERYGLSAAENGRRR
jgi:cation diffusion facilitator family transporter